MESPVNPLLETQDQFISRIKYELEPMLREDLALEGIAISDSDRFEGVYAAWFFTRPSAWTIDRLDERLEYIYRQMSLWREEAASRNPHLPQIQLIFHVRRFEDHFQIFDVPEIVWPIDLLLRS